VPQWFQQRGGSVHLGWFCCGKAVQGPIPQKDAKYYDIESYEHAVARLTVQQDATWAVETGARLF
jgi:hypothetical protein